MFWAVVGALAAVALVVAGCGGGDETTSLTRAQFVKQGNAICKKQEDRRSKMILDAVESAPKDKELPQSAQKALVLQTLPPYEEMAEELEDLGAPEGDEAKIEALVEAMEKAASNIKEEPLQVISNKGQYEEANDLAVKYGLTECTL